MAQRVKSGPVDHGTGTRFPISFVFVLLDIVAGLRQQDLERSSVDDPQEPAFVPPAFSPPRFVESLDGAGFPFPAEQETDRTPGNVHRIFPIGIPGTLRKNGVSVDGVDRVANVAANIRVVLLPGIIVSGRRFRPYSLEEIQRLSGPVPFVERLIERRGVQGVDPERVDPDRGHLPEPLAVRPFLYRVFSGKKSRQPDPEVDALDEQPLPLSPMDFQAACPGPETPLVTRRGQRLLPDVDFRC